MGSPEPICRICGATDGESFIEIFSAEGERNYLEHKLNYCFTKEVSVTKCYLDKNMLSVQVHIEYHT